MNFSGYHSLSSDRSDAHGSSAGFSCSRLICTIAFAGFVLLDSDSKTDGLPDWEVLDVCLADHSGSISHIHATLSVTINGNNILIPDDVGAYG